MNLIILYVSLDVVVSTDQTHPSWSAHNITKDLVSNGDLKVTIIATFPNVNILLKVWLIVSF